MAEQQKARPLGFPFDGKYLKVLSPVTWDGMVPKVDEETGVAEYKESHHPLSAKKFLEEQNESLPRHLRKKIVVVDSDTQRMDAEAKKIADGKSAPPALGKTIKKAEVDELIK